MAFSFQMSQRVNPLQSLVDARKQKMPAAPTSGSAVAAPQAPNQFQNQLTSYLGQAAPQMPTSNRFEAGLGQAEGRVNSLLDDPNSIQQSAAYKFRLGQGQEALQRQQAAKGMLGSGNRLTELMDYGQGQASQEYGNQFNRLQGLMNTQTQGYLGERGANVSQFGAENQAFGQRGNMLANLYNTGVSADTSRYGTDVGAKSSADALALANLKYQEGKPADYVSRWA